MTDPDMEAAYEMLLDRLAPLMTAHERLREAPYGSAAEGEARAAVMGAVADLRAAGIRTEAEREAQPMTPARREAEALAPVFGGVPRSFERLPRIDG
ncbi:MAG: hypothetical protein AAFQ81_05660 [Pseudomonadota bacterium]